MDSIGGRHLLLGRLDTPWIAFLSIPGDQYLLIGAYDADGLLVRAEEVAVGDGAQLFQTPRVFDKEQALKAAKDSRTSSLNGPALLLSMTMNSPLILDLRRRPNPCLRMLSMGSA